MLPPVAVEHLSDVPKSACAKITNDVRKRAAFLINEAWDSLAWDATDEDMLRFNLKNLVVIKLNLLMMNLESCLI